jgi:hypothetical protein
MVKFWPETFYSIIAIAISGISWISSLLPKTEIPSTPLPVTVLPLNEITSIFSL